MERIEKDVISYCSIPQELTESSWLKEFTCDCYVPYTLSKDKNEHDTLDSWIYKQYPTLLGESFLIYMDY